MDASIEARSVSVIYETAARSFPIFESLDETVRYGEVVAVIGPSGSGKSSLLRVMSGTQRPSAGTVSYFDETGNRLSSSPTIGFVFQDYRLVPFLTAIENVELAAELAHGKADRSSIHSLFDRLGIRELQDRLPSQLSGGEQQRVAIARSLSIGARTLLADEPTGALDADSSAGIGTLLADLAHEEGLAIVVATHDPAIFGRVDRVHDLASVGPSATV